MSTGGRRPRIVSPVVLALAAVLLVLVAGAAPMAGTALVVLQPLGRDPQAIVSLASHDWERLPATARLAAQFPRAVVLLTVPEKVTPFNCHDCANRTHRLSLAGVQQERVQAVRLTAGGTHGEALAVRRWATQHDVKSVLVVTSPYHTRRALATFRAALNPVGIEVGIEPATASSPAMPDHWWAMPYDRAYVGYEWAGLVYYAVRYSVWLG